MSLELTNEVPREYAHFVALLLGVTLNITIPFTFYALVVVVVVVVDAPLRSLLPLSVWAPANSCRWGLQILCW
jgi:hypothetical protein